MVILQQIENRGYPTDYLTARIKGRSTGLFENWDNLLYSPDLSEDLKRTHYERYMSEYSREGAWKRFLSETKWLYYQMNSVLQDIFRPFMIYMELKTLLICLRYKLSKVTGAEIEKLLYFSLIAGKLKKILIEKEDLTSVLEELEKHYLFSSSDLCGLNEIFLKDGLKGLEQKLSAAFLEGINESRPHPVLREFFLYITDSKNIITAYKHIKWDLTSAPFFIRGGTISLSGLKKCVNENDKTEINKLVYRLTGTAIDEVNDSSLESTLQSSLTRKLKRVRFESDDIGLILNYMWKCYIEAKNISIILYGRGIDENVLKEQLVY